ncbi:hypothetical protein [Curtobacterium sp. RRHDQ10]|uniref:hypothetical protein n=1 Tax=Curtobacterium phyllosphaerae TaxID=3413379 RepID=UPI003BF11B51
MHSTYRTFQTPGDARVHTGGSLRLGITDPAVIAAYVSRRIEDPSLLSTGSGPSYGDFFRSPAA